MRLPMLLASLLTLVLTTTARSQDLDAAQQQLLGQIEARLKRAESNFRTAERGVPKRGKPSGAKVKLALVRLGGAKGDLKAATDALKKLPAGNAAVAAVAKRATDLTNAIAAFEARLGASSAPPPSDGKKLDYRDEERLKNAHFYVREADGLAGTLETLVTKVRGVKNPDLIDHRPIAQGIATLNKGRQRCGFIRDALAELPADGRGVQSTAQSLAKLTQRFDAAHKALAPVHARLQKIIHPSTYPNLDADRRRLEELSGMVRDAAMFDTRPDIAPRVLPQIKGIQAELQRAAKTYALLIRQRVELGKRIDGAVRSLHGNLQGLAKAVAEQKKTLPGRIDADIAEAAKMAAQAVKEKKPGWFNGGVPQRMGWAEDKVTLLEALDASAGKAARAKLAKAEATLRAQQDSLRADIIAANQLPPDTYDGPDRDKVIARAKAAWLKVQPKAEILGARIPSSTWARETMWRLQNTTWYRIDRSKLQVQLLVRHDADTAVIQAINLWIDHMKNDRETQFPLHEPGEKLPPNFYLLTKKIK